MNVFTFRKREAPDNPYYSAWRWAFKIDTWSVGFNSEHRSRQTGEWNLSGLYYEANVTRYFLWGFHHDYYDGPHCGLSIGWLHFNWSGNPWTYWCEKCAGNK